MGELVTFGVEKLWELLSKEYELFQGAGDQVTELKNDLQVLKSFLKDADAKKHTSELVKTYVEQIKEIIYDAEDTVETFVLKNKRGETSGTENRVRRLSCIIPKRIKIAEEMKGTSTRITKVIHDMKSFGIRQEMVADGGSTAQPLHDRQREMRQTFSNEYENNLIGLEENIKRLVELMVEEENVQVVSITGMGGVGKTTLARQVFNHEKVKHHFDGLVWVCVSQEFSRNQVWQAIFKKLKPQDDEKKISEMTEAKLQDELYQLLGTSKSLVVFDDIWKKEHWDLIKKIFPAEKGSKVLLTSRNKRVAGPSNTRHINFQSECLSEENSWILLQRIAFPKRDESELKAGEEMENMTKQMIKHCSGLPLAIKVLGGLLAEKFTVYDWGRISKGIRSRILTEDNDNGSVGHILSLSFEELPQYLKECFLYLAHFPEDYTISVELFSYYLAAEEIIPKTRYYNEDTIRDVGDSYIEQLVRRNMVISERKASSSRFETCQLHDMMREICLSKAKEENFLRIVGIKSPSPDSQSHSTSRRLVSLDATTFVETDLNNPKLRCLLLFASYNEYVDWMFPCSSFTRLQLLRVLDLRSAKFKGGKLSSSIGKLIHLRYLSLSHAKVSHLPSSLRNLKLLIYLDICIPGDGIFVPNILMEMRELRFLALPWYMHKKTKLELSNLVKLETLKNFSTRSSNIKDCHGMSGLRKLTITVNDDEISKQTLSASIVGLIHLEHLRITDDRSDSMKEDGQFVLDCIHLQYLKLDIHIPRVQLQLPTHLTFIAMTRCKFEEDPMPILEKLPHLEVVILGNRSFCGGRMVCSGGGFPKLQDLALVRLDYLEEWVVEEGSMPLLHTLIITECHNLKEIPGGLRFIHSLKELSVEEIWEERLKEGGEDYYKVQRIPSVIFDYTYKKKGGRFHDKSLVGYGASYYERYARSFYERYAGEAYLTQRTHQSTCVIF